MPRWHSYLTLARQYADEGVFDPQLERLRWMVEEYRVSLFAQQLGTIFPVSDKRLDEQWALVGQQQ